MADFLKRRHLEELPKKYRLQTKYAKGLLDKFKKLECPFTEKADETWIVELVFKPGESRIRILQWLLSKFHKSLYNFLDPIYSRPEARLQAILQMASTIGLCRPTDLELIEGKTKISLQKSFMDKLLDMVLIQDNAESYVNNSPSKFTIRDSTEIPEQFSRDCALMDSIVKQQSVWELFPPDISVLPIDVQRSLEQANRELAADREERVLPDLQQLTDRATIVEEELCKQMEIFKQLKSEHTVAERDDKARHKTITKFRLILSELHQVVTSYSYCYENHIQPWCNREPPALSKLGGRIQSIQRLLSNFTTLIGSLKVIKSSHSRLEDTNRSLSQAMEGSEDKGKRLQRLYESLNTLEQSINTLNASL